METEEPYTCQCCSCLRHEHDWTKSLVRVKEKTREPPPASPVVAILYAMDFDYTIIDRNSDSAIMTLLRHPIPEEIRNSYDGTNWTEYMDSIMAFLALEEITVSQILRQLKNIPLSPGMTELLERIRIARLENVGSKFIVVSDANEFFITAVLNNLPSPIIPDAIFSNKAMGLNKLKLDKLAPDGKPVEISYLRITAFEDQICCPLCPRNLCKGKALMNYIEQAGPFSVVYYCGDGKNDICAGMALSERDTLFVRHGFTLERAIGAGVIHNTEIKILAKIVYYTDASEIQNCMTFPIGPEYHPKPQILQVQPYPGRKTLELRIRSRSEDKDGMTVNSNSFVTSDRRTSDSPRSHGLKEGVNLPGQTGRQI